MKALQKRAEHKARNRQQLAELEMKALRAQINPHFIFNALNSIQSYYSQNDELKANHYMTSFALFIRLTLIHSQSHWLPLRQEIAMLRTYIELEQMRFKELFSFTIICGPGVEPAAISMPAMLIQPYVENAINHGLRYLKGRKGLLTLKFIEQKDVLLCEVEDNGVGRGYAGNSAPPKHISLGMKINRERIDTMNRMYDIDIRIAVVDKQTDSGTPEGTLITLFIPLKKTNQVC